MRSLCLQSWHFDGQSLGSLKWEKKMCLVPKTLINLLLLNSNNLTHWSRERPICFLWGSVSFPAGADSVIRDDGREAGGVRTFNVIRSSHWGDTHEGTQDLPKEALLHITADSQLCEDTGSGSLGSDWIQQTFIECLWVEPTLIRHLLVWALTTQGCLLLTYTTFSSPLSNSEDGGIILLHRKGKGNRDFCGDPGNYATVGPTPTIVNLISFLNYYLGAETSPQQGYGCPARTHCRGKPDLPCGGHSSHPTFL